jgi:flagellar biogenesis protein FliO
VLLGFSLYKRFAKKVGLEPTGETIEVVSRKALSSRTSLLIVKVEQHTVLLSQNGDDVTFLTDITAAPVPVKQPELSLKTNGNAPVAQALTVHG